MRGIDCNYKCFIDGPPNTPYEKGEYEIEINFHWYYPILPPNIKFLTKIYHVNIDDNGNVNIPILQSTIWNKSDTQTLRAVWFAKLYIYLIHSFPILLYIDRILNIFVIIFPFKVV